MTFTVTREKTNLGSILLTAVDSNAMVACLEYFWVKDLADIRAVGRGQQPRGGEILYVTNIATSRPDLSALLVLKQHLPPHRYIAGLRLLIPKGVPVGFFARTDPEEVHDATMVLA